MSHRVIYDVSYPEDSIRDLKDCGIQAFIQPSLFDERLDIVIMENKNASSQPSSKKIHTRQS